MKVNIYFILSFVLFSTIIHAQPNKAKRDSLQLIVKSNNQDTTKVRAYLQLAKLDLYHDPKQCKAELGKAKSLAEKIKWNRGIAECHKLQGVIYYEERAYKESIKEYKSALQLINEHRDSKLMSDLNNNLGNTYTEMLEFPLALDHFFKSLSINEKSKNQKGISMNCLNIGVLYSTKLSNTTEALRYFKRSLKASQSINDTLLMSEGYSGIAQINSKQEKKDSALYYYQKSYNLDKLINNVRGECYTANNMACIYAEQKKLDYADSLFNLSLEKSKKSNLKKISIEVLKNLSSINIDRAKLNDGLKAKEYIDIARRYIYAGLDSIRSTSVVDTPHTFYTVLSEIEELSGNYGLALYYLKNGRKITDSLNGEENTKRIDLLEKERKSFEIKLAEDERMDKERNAKMIQLLSIFTAILISFSIIFFLTSKKLNLKIVHLLGTFSVLAIFELITLLIHPFLEKITHHNLIVMLLILILIAAFIIPIHHQTEKWVKDFIIKRINKAKKDEKTIPTNHEM